MKKQLPTPVVVGVAVLAIAIVIGLFVKGTAGPPPIPAPKRAPNYQEGIPDYVKNAGQPGNKPAGGPQPGQIPTGANGSTPPGAPAMPSNP